MRGEFLLGTVGLFLLSASPAAVSAQGSLAPVEQEGRPNNPYTLRVTTREVVVDVIAVDGHDQPVRDLSPADLTVLDEAENTAAARVAISSLRIVNPELSSGGEAAAQQGFRLGGVETCLDRASVHYELAYHPGSEAEKSGYHTVEVRTSRRGVRLFYRHRYYVGLTDSRSDRASSNQKKWEKELYEDACSHLVVPASIGLRAVRVETGATDTVRYSVDIDADALAFISFSGNGRRVQLDYGACNFNAAGKPISYQVASTDQVLSSVQFARAQAHGFHRLFDMQRPDGLAMTRFIVRDRATGNLGMADVVFPSEPQPPDPALQRMLEEDLKGRLEWDWGTGSGTSYHPPPLGPLGSFGSVVPAPNTFCGDVFELHAGIPGLPDFRTLDPIGSIYTSYLGVPDQIFINTAGIPGVTDRTIWFGVDYHADFWISTPGKYEFELMSDDGALLQIDDQHIIDLNGLHMAARAKGHIQLDVGRHTIHVPYYEGTPDAVALTLWVRPPGQDWRLFDLREFAKPQ